MNKPTPPILDKGWRERLEEKIRRVWKTGEHMVDEHYFVDYMLDLYQQELHTAIEEGCKDKERLDFLDKCNQNLNNHYGTNYGWKLILNHNVTRLLSEGIDLHDSEGGNTKLPSCRDAIDEVLAKYSPSDKETTE